MPKFGNDTALEYDSDMYAKCKFGHQSKAHRRNIHLLYKHLEAKHKNEMSNKIELRPPGRAGISTVIIPILLEDPSLSKS